MCAVHTLAYFQTGDMKDVITERGPYGHFDGTLFIQCSKYEFWSVVQEYWNICLVHVLPVLLQTFNIVLSIPTKIKSISM